MMKTTLAIAFAGTIAGAAHADLSTATITADNHYAMYTSTGNTFTFIGGNEIGYGGAPGTYNWSEAESHTFQAGDAIYIAAWSDDSVAQGVLGEFHIAGLGTVISGDSLWQVIGTGNNLGDGDPYPTTVDIAGYVANANANNLWEGIFAGDSNGAQPWGTIAGVDGEARWMWKNVVGDNDPTQGGSGAGEMLIFRITVPTPGSLAVLGMGGMAALRRRRK